jgi:hypothetical protein
VRWKRQSSTILTMNHLTPQQRAEIVKIYFQKNSSVTLLRDFLADEVDEHDMDDYWFQQDGATCHTARLTMDLLRAMFPNRLISKYGDFDWPARSPDLTAPDFFLWGYLKGKVYADKPATLQQLKANIRREIAAIEPETLKKVMENAEKRADLCVASGGGHLADVIFKK